MPQVLTSEALPVHVIPDHARSVPPTLLRATRRDAPDRLGALPGLPSRRSHGSYAVVEGRYIDDLLKLCGSALQQTVDLGAFVHDADAQVPPPQPVAWAPALLWMTSAALLSIGVIAAQHQLWPRLSPAPLFWPVFVWLVVGWYRRPVRNRGVATGSAGFVLTVAVCGSGIWLWGDDRKDHVLIAQTVAVWLATLTFVAATHVVRRSSGPDPAASSHAG